MYIYTLSRTKGSQAASLKEYIFIPIFMYVQNHHASTFIRTDELAGTLEFLSRTR